jgi:hypothetical protein
MVVTIVTFYLPQPTTLPDMTAIFQLTAARYQSVEGLLRKNYWLSEDCCRAGAVYVWKSRADAERFYTSEWKKNVENKYGAAPLVEYLHSPVMVDNGEQRITIEH